jgi:hypothetical protein
MDMAGKAGKTSKKKNRNREWYLRNRDKALQYSKDYRLDHPEKRKERRWHNKCLVLFHYSHSKIPRCECCGESYIEFLTIDHIDGGGERHRKSIGRRAGYEFYIWLIKNGFPNGYRVLCLNCNTSIGLYGYCPHKTKGAH